MTRRKIILISLIVALVSILALAYFYLVFPLWGMPFNTQRHGNPPLTPAWALECWLWEDDVHSAEYVDELLRGYAQHDIPVRTVIIDSPWSRRYNDFEIDTELYPEHWFTKLQDEGYIDLMTPRSLRDLSLLTENFHSTNIRSSSGKGPSYRWMSNDPTPALAHLTMRAC